MRVGETRCVAGTVDRDRRSPTAHRRSPVSGRCRVRVAGSAPQRRSSVAMRTSDAAGSDAVGTGDGCDAARYRCETVTQRSTGMVRQGGRPVRSREDATVSRQCRSPASVASARRATCPPPMRSGEDAVPRRHRRCPGPYQDAAIRRRPAWIAGRQQIVPGSNAMRNTIAGIRAAPMVVTMFRARTGGRRDVRFVHLAWQRRGGRAPSCHAGHRGARDSRKPRWRGRIHEFRACTARHRKRVRTPVRRAAVRRHRVRRPWPVSGIRTHALPHRARRHGRPRGRARGPRHRIRTPRSPTATGGGPIHWCCACWHTPRSGWPAARSGC